MKIGILGAFYNCAKDVPKVLSPFLGREFVLSACNIQFSEFSPTPDEETFDALMSVPETIYIATSPVPLKEHEARSMAMNYLLEQDVDYIWVLDGDEFYTREEVDRIVYLLAKNSPWVHVYYSIAFKNYVFDGKCWIAGFRPPRIFSNRICGGLDKFFWDNDVLYKDGTAYSNHREIQEYQIPTSVAHVKHMTWLHSNGKEKVEYQLKHFGACSYRWDDKENLLKFDEMFYARQGKQIPELHHD